MLQNLFASLSSFYVAQSYSVLLKGEDGPILEKEGGKGKKEDRRVVVGLYCM